MSDVTFMRGSLFDSIDKFANSLGYENAGIAIQLALVPWETPDERDLFIQAITGDDVQGGKEKTYPLKNLGR